MAITRFFLGSSYLRLSSFQGTKKALRQLFRILPYGLILTKEIAPSKLNKQASQQYESKDSHSDCLYGNILRKEVIQPHLPIRLPCYDFTPIICPTLGGWLQKVTPPTSGVTNSRGVTGGVYKARERIHRGMLIRDY